VNNFFWNDFLANFVSDLLVGGLLGVALTYWVGKRLTEFERSRQRKDEKRAELEKAVRYLELLRQEVKYLVDRLPGLINAFQQTGWGREIRMPTPFWDVLRPSGELPGILDARILASLTGFYDPIAYAKRGVDLVIEGWLVSVPSSVPGMTEKLQAFQDMAVSGLNEALLFGRNLPDELSAEIERLKTDLAAL